MSELLSVRALYKSFPSGKERLEVIQGLSLAIQAGEMVSISGESGCGKSTLLNLVGAMEPPDSGQIVFDGDDVADLKGDDLARFRNLSIGFVFQFHHLLPEFSALENVMFPLQLRGEPSSSAGSAARELLKEVGLEGRLSHQPGELSGGEQQRVAIARALAGRPRLLLADEPTGNLDPATSEQIQQLLMTVHRNHSLTSLIVTHSRALASKCDRHFRMVGGRLHVVK